jgi:pyruvate carboxylase
VGAPLPGLVVGVAVVAGDPVRKGQKLLSIEAMKMETTLYAERPGRIAEVLAHVGQQVKTGELLLKMTTEPAATHATSAAVVTNG